jgi:hypothetical protein
MDRVDKVTLAYLAGLFDGDGTVYINKSKPYGKYGKSPNHWLIVGIANTYQELIDWLKDNFGGWVKKGSKNRLQVLHWTLSSNEGSDFLNKILPYLRIKKRQANLAIEFQIHKKLAVKNNPGNRALSSEEIEKRDWYKQRLSSLNIKGK